MNRPDEYQDRRTAAEIRRDMRLLRIYATHTPPNPVAIRPLPLVKLGVAVLAVLALVMAFC